MAWSYNKEGGRYYDDMLNKIKCIKDVEDIGRPINADNWVDSAQDRNYWRSLMNVALNLRVP